MFNMDLEEDNLDKSDLRKILVGSDVHSLNWMEGKSLKILFLVEKLTVPSSKPIICNE